MARWIAEETSYIATLFGFNLGRLLVRVLPRRPLFRCSDALAGFAFLVSRKYRTLSTANIMAALSLQNPDEARAVARRSLRNFFRSCLEIVVAMESSDAECRALIPVTGLEHLNRGLAQGNGVVILSAHLGNFFLLGTRLAMEGHRVHVVVNQPREGNFGKLKDRYRLRIRLHTIHARPRQMAVREISNALQKGGIVVIIADEYRKGNGVPATFFGRTVLARRGPVIFAARTGAAIIPACVFRQADDTLKLVIEPELELIRPGRAPEEISENVARLTRWVERTVSAYPDQWNWMNIRWWKESAGTPDSARLNNDYEIATEEKGSR